MAVSSQPRQLSALPGKSLELADPLALLAQAAALLAHAKTRTLAFSLDQWGDVELPASSVTEDDQAQIRAMAPLYLAQQLDAAGLIPAVEVLAGLAMSGGMNTDLGPAADMIAAFWQRRRERFSEEERRAIYAQLFGDLAAPLPHGAARAPGQSNRAFEDLMITVCESLFRLTEIAGPRDQLPVYAQTQIRTAARMIADNLLNRAGGMTAFAAEEILATLQQAVDILKQTTVQRAFGARSVWAAVRVIAERYWTVNPDMASFVSRGKAGVVVLSWLADNLPFLDTSSRSIVTLDHPVIPAATEWLEASLTIGEASAAGA
jgi:hypothetical protein